MSKNDHEHLLDRIFEQNKMAKNDHEHLFDSFTGLALNVGKREHRKDAVPITPEFDTVVSITITPRTCDDSTSTKTHTFRIHKQRICDASYFFKTAFTGSFEEGQTQCMKLDDVDPLVFGLLVNFLYCKEVVYYNSQDCSPTLTTFGKLWVLADRFLIRELKEHVSEAMVKWFNDEVQVINNSMDYGWKNVVEQFVEFLDFIRDRDDNANMFWLRRFAVVALVESTGFASTPCLRTPDTFYNHTIDFADAELKEQLLRQLKERKEENQGHKQITLDKDMIGSLYY